MANKKERNQEKEIKTTVVLVGLLFLELVVFIFLFFSVLLPSVDNVLAVVGTPNATVRTTLTVGNNYPEILSVIINNGSTITLSANTTKTVTFYIVARDWNNESDISRINVTFFDMSHNFGDANDNNYHYSNDSCVINYTFGTEYEVNATCTIDVWYYANNATWNATAVVTDQSNWTGMGSNKTTINELLAFAMPDSIDYGTVNATAVSEEQVANVTNAGNIIANLSLSGYAVSVGDNWSMNCTRGTVQNISIYYEKYLLNRSVSGTINYTQFQANYTNLTSNPIVRSFNVPQRLNDTWQFIDDTNSTYWRIYVPIGVAGSCSGNIVFGAVKGPGNSTY
jgi:hypothetical protein